MNTLAQARTRTRFHRPCISSRSSRAGRRRCNTSVRSSLNIDDLVDVPDIADDLRQFQEKLGAEFDDAGVALRYAEDVEWKAREAWQFGVVLADRSHWGRLRLSGNGRLRFVHSQSTQALLDTPVGTARETVFVTATGRTIDKATVLAQKRGVLLLVSPGMAAPLTKRLRKHIFPMDEVELSDIGPATKMFSVVGPGSDELVEDWGGDSLVALQEKCHTVVAFNGTPVIVLRTSGLGGSVPGWTFILDEAAASDFWRKAALKGALPMGTEAWEEARILSGVPACGAELTEAFNPLETGLYHAVSLAKGCYIGQETIAKVYNTKGERQQLWGLRLRDGATCAPGEPLLDSAAADAKKIGVVTSAVELKTSGFALGYVRSKQKGAPIELEGSQVYIRGEPAKVVAVTALTRTLPDGAAPPRKDEAGAEVLDKEAAAAAKAAKLKAMQDRLNAWKEKEGAGGQ